jgi:hypothetical protein
MITEINIIPTVGTSVTVSVKQGEETIYDSKSINLSPADEAAIIAIIQPYLNS